MRSKYFFLAIGVLFVNIQLYAQVEKLNIDASTHGVVASDDLRPTWLTANEWGMYDQFGKSEALFNIGASYQLLQNDVFSLIAGVRGIANVDIGQSVLQEAYLKGHLWFVDYSIGKEQYSPLVYNEELTSGMYLMNSNARPVPRVTLGIFDYLPLGFTKNWVEIKGGMSQGWMNDDRGSKGNSANDLLLHEKFAYIRLGNTKIQPYVGLMHSALFGGTRPNGTEIPVDFWATFMAKGSATLGGGEETNAAGAHMGLWDFGLNWSNDFGDIHFYWQKPFADGSGLRLYNSRNKDNTIGLLVYPKDIKWLKGVSVEIFKSDYQSGYGIPDPLYPVDYNGHSAGSIIWMEDIEEDLDGFMLDVFDETKTGWTSDEVLNYLEVELNEGHKYGGRDDYMNNGTYYNGWTYQGVNMGTPLYHTGEKVRKYAEALDEIDQVVFYNNRVNGFHIGAEGRIRTDLNYRLKTTYTLNKGSYGEKFRGRGSWNRTSGYFFEEDKNQFYTMLELSWQTNWIKGMQLSALLAYDFGELYHSTGGRFSISYTPQF